MRTQLAAAGLLLLLAGLVGCGEESPLPPAPTGSIAITSSTTGSSFDSDGYTVSIDGSQARTIGVNASTTYERVPVGDYDVELAGVDSNCSIQGPNSQAVTVTEGGTASVGFSVTCVSASIGQIVFQSTRDGESAIYMMDADGANPVRLSGATAGDFAPDVSPDGTRIAVSRLSDAGPNTQRNHVWVMDADGSNPVQLTTGTPYDILARWSPDGSKLAFASGRDGNAEIYVMNADGSNPVRLTNNAAQDWSATWSPDGSKIAFQTSRDGNAEIYVMNADGSNQVRLTNNASSDDTPDWSPDGSKIVFASDRGSQNDVYEVWVMNADGSNPVRLTNGVDSNMTPGVYLAPRWSPDGSKIAFVSELGNNNEDIAVMDADGSNVVRLTTHPSNDGLPAWGP